MEKVILIIDMDKEEEEAAEIYVLAKIDDKEYKFLFDTGAARTCVQFDQNTALYESYNSNLSSGLFSKDQYDLIKVPKVKFGPIEKTNFEITRSNPKNEKFRNLIGMDLLKESYIEFNFKQRFVQIDPITKAHSTNLNQILLVDSKYHPYILITFEEKEFYAVWDTGAGITIVDLSLIDKFPHIFQKIGDSIGTDSTGTKMETPLYSMEGMFIAGKLFPSQKVAGVDLSFVNSSTEIRMDMILGYNTLNKQNWIFNFKGKKWDFY